MHCTRVYLEDRWSTPSKSVFDTRNFEFHLTSVHGCLGVAATVDLVHNVFRM